MFRLAVTLLGAAALHAAPAGASEGQATPTALPAPLPALVAAWNAHDLNAAAALFGDDAALTYVVDAAPPGRPRAFPDEPFNGKEEIRSFLSGVLPGAKVELTEPRAENGRVRATLRAAGEAFRALGLEQVDGVLDVAIESGKLVSAVWTLSPESGAKVALATPAANKALVRRFFDRVNRKDFSVVDEVSAPTFVQHTSMPMGPGMAGLKEFYRQFGVAFPDFHFTIEDMIAEGDRVSVRITSRYTHRGEFMGIAPTGKPVTVAKMDILRFLNGKMLEHWDVVDRLGMLQQIGVVPKLPQWETSLGYEGFR